MDGYFYPKKKKALKKMNRSDNPKRLNEYLKDGHNIITSFSQKNHYEKETHCPCFYASQDHFIHKGEWGKLSHFFFFF